MAVTFSLRLSRPPTEDELRALLDEPDAVIEDPIPDPWREGYFTHVYVPGVSTRGLEIGPEAGEFTVRALSNAAVEELDLAVRLVAGLARREGATIRRDGSGDLDVDAFLATYDSAWMARTVEQDFAALREIAAERVITLPGPGRSVAFGPKTLARVGPGAEPLLRVMRDVLYPNGVTPEDEGELYVSKGIRIEREGRAITIHAVASDVSYFLSPCDVYALLDQPPVHIAASELPRLAPEHVTPVDEASVRLRALVDDEWAELLDRARAVGAEDPFAVLPPLTQPAPPEGTLLPHLRPPAWRHRDASATRPLLESKQPIEHLPLVTIVADTPRTTASMPKEGWAGLGTFAEAEADAVANLEALDLPFREDVEEGQLVGLTVVGEYAAELLVSKRRLDEAHAKLGPIVVAAAPVRGVLRFRRGDDPMRTSQLVAWAQAVFEDAGKRPDGPPSLTPLCFGVFDGKVAALVQVRAKDAEDSAPEPEEETEATEPGGGAIERAAQQAQAPTPDPLGLTPEPASAVPKAFAPEPPAEPPASGNSLLLVGGLVAVVVVAVLAYTFLA